MPRYIDADELLKLYTLNIPEEKYFNVPLEVVQQNIKDMITADVQEVRHGKWVLEYEPDGHPYCFHCSVCDDDFHYISIKTAYKYCPNCGAKMDLGEK